MGESGGGSGETCSDQDHHLEPNRLSNYLAVRPSTELPWADVAQPAVAPAGLGDVSARRDEREGVREYERSCASACGETGDESLSRGTRRVSVACARGRAAVLGCGQNAAHDRYD